MSESRTKLSQILELLLAEDNAKAEEMLHEYVVAKARAEYERVLEAEDDEFGGEVVDQSNDFEADIADDEGEIDADEEGDEEGEDLEGEEGGEEGEESEGDDLEDKVEDLEAELEALRAEFEALMADEADEPEHADMDFGDEVGMDDMDGDAVDGELVDSYDYDLDEDIVEEATNFSNKVGAPKPGQDDNPKGFTAPKKHFKMDGQAVPRIKDGSIGDHGKVAAKNDTPTNNLGIKPKKV